ncbi:MAG: hypothetical protein M9887_02980 [Chitinophagales bacterium]|nr:hypothetical protein [Chitinophagales bacterium]
MFKNLAFILLLVGTLYYEPTFAQSARLQKPAEEYEFVYHQDWSANFKLRSDGWQLGFEMGKSKIYTRSLIYQIDLGLYNHPKQAKQNKDPYAGWFSSNGIKPFIYGKQNTLFALHGAVGQRFLVAEKAKHNGVMINYYYAGGITLGLLKPYYLRVCGDDLCTYYDVVSYHPDEDNGFIDYDKIIGGAGFGVGWKLKFRPGLHAKTGLQFDWSSQSSMIKAVDIGLSVDSYFSKVPIMVTKANKFIFVNAFVGISLGKKKL